VTENALLGRARGIRRPSRKCIHTGNREKSTELCEGFTIESNLCAPLGPAICNNRMLNRLQLHQRPFAIAVLLCYVISKLVFEGKVYLTRGNEILLQEFNILWAPIRLYLVIAKLDASDFRYALSRTIMIIRAHLTALAVLFQVLRNENRQTCTLLII
jgi:hypothetical protein